jgi:hypothetical protein
MIQFLTALTFAIAWGIAENRLFKEQGEWAILNHFKQYHVFLFFLVGLVAFLGCEGNPLMFIFHLLWAPLMLDVAWWVIRYYDFKRDRQSAIVAYNGEVNAWHQQGDWDAWNLPIWFGVYSWWYIMGAALAVLAVFIVIIPIPPMWIV